MKTLSSFLIVFSCLLPAQGQTLSILRKSGMTGGKQSVTLPYRSTFRGIVVAVSINGKPVDLVLDTGGSGTLLSPETARQLGLELFQGGLRVESTTGEQAESPQAIIKRITLGDAWTENEAVAVFEPPPGVAGILGVGTLADWDIRIDPSAQQLTLFASGQAPSLEGETILPLSTGLPSPKENPQVSHRIRDMILTVPLRVGSVQISCIPNTGFGGIVQLSSGHMEKSGLGAMKEAQPKIVTSVSLTGEVATRTVRLPLLHFGPDTLRDFPVDVMDVPEGSEMQKQGLIGLNLLRHYVMTFRLAKGELRLKPLGTVQEIARSSTAGINMDADQRVLSVDPGGPADKAGLRAGDLVMEIAGRPLRTLTPKDMAALKSLPPGSIVPLLYRRGDAAPVEINLVMAKE